MSFLMIDISYAGPLFSLGVNCEGDLMGIGKSAVATRTNHCPPRASGAAHKRGRERCQTGSNHLSLMANLHLRKPGFIEVDREGAA